MFLLNKKLCRTSGNLLRNICDIQNTMMWARHRKLVYLYLKWVSNCLYSLLLVFFSLAAPLLGW